MAHTITVEISETGEVKATVNGISGAKCADASKWLDEIGQVIEDKKTPDYYRQQAVGGKLKIGGA